jgi:hypothetical protein
MTSRPDLRRVEGLVHPSFLDAAQETSRILGRLGVRHALIGGLAVGAYGYPRATKDVDFVVGLEAFATIEPILTFKSGIPLEVKGVAVDVLADSGVQDPKGVRTLEVPVISLATLTYLKLKAFRLQDQTDLVALLRGGGNLLGEMSKGVRGEEEHLLRERWKGVVTVANGAASPARRRR